MIEVKILVCGDRNWSSKLIIKEYLKYFQPSLVIEGGARGADRLAGVVARELGVPVKVFPAKWNEYGR